MTMSTNHEPKSRGSRPPGKSPIKAPPRSYQVRVKNEAHLENTASSSSSTSNATNPPQANSTKSSPESKRTSAETQNDTARQDGPSKDKDKRISELEQELSTMESEFSRELTSLSHKLTHESETAQFWQQKHSTLHASYQTIETELRHLRQELGATSQTKEDRDRDIKTRISSLMLDRDAFREAYNEAMAEVRSKEEEVRELRGQVRGLKSWVSASGKGEEQVADEVFGERMQRLGNGLQNWVIMNFRRMRIDISKANHEVKDLLLRLVPTYESLASSSKVHLLQSIVSRLIFESIFEPFFVGLPAERADQLRSVEHYLSGFGTSESMNQWRSTTLAITLKEAPQRLASSTATILETIINQINTIMSAIGDILPSETRDQSLRALITNSIDLARLLRVQKAVFSVVMPSLEGHQMTMFDPTSMEDIGGEDEESLQQREIRCVTFPGIVKTGDENGEKSYLRNVVAKIRVLCAPD